MLRKSKMLKSLVTSFALAAASMPSLCHEFEVASILIDKSDRRLELRNDKQRVLRSYKIGLGFNPIGDKVRQGDGRTPEGRYIIESRNPQSAYTLSLRISYPNAADRREARRLGVNPGGDIYIHGTPTGKPDNWTHWRGRDWTFGCIALKNKDMREIYSMVKDGTPITIQP